MAQPARRVQKFSQPRVSGQTLFFHVHRSTLGATSDRGSTYRPKYMLRNEKRDPLPDNRGPTNTGKDVSLDMKKTCL